MRFVYKHEKKLSEHSSQDLLTTIINVIRGNFMRFVDKHKIIIRENFMRFVDTYNKNDRSKFHEIC